MILVSTFEYENLKKENEDQQLKITYLEYQLAQLKRMIYGAKSERFVPANNPEQLSLAFEENEEESQEEPEAETTQISYERKKRANKKGKAVRAPIPAHLPRQTEVIEPENIPEGAKKIGEEVTEILEMNPGKLYVRQIVRPKYAMPEDEGVVIGSLPSLPIPKSNAGASLLAHILISKFTDHLPFYRIRQQFKRQGLDVAESTLCGWFSAVSRLLKPLYEVLLRQTLSDDYLQADETPIPVLTSQKPGSTHKGYHWVYHSPLQRLVLFDYRKSRSREGPVEILKEFTGALQTDGYGGYNGFEQQEGITLLACMAHARRKFDQAKDNDYERAAFVLKKMKLLYMTERKAREQNLSYSQRKELRQQESVAVLEELEQWLKSQLSEVMPKSAIGKAIQYTLKLWPRLRRYTEDGRWEIDNNLIENAIRPVALGRKNYLFAGSHEGAQRAAMMYSFLGTCKINKVEPFAWLKDILERIPDHPVNRLDELLPPNWQPSGNEGV